MKELKPAQDMPIISKHYPISQRQPTKRWVIAQARPEKLTVMQNECAEAAYHRVIDTVKKLYLKPGEVYYERDTRKDRSAGFLSMHSFITPHFYWVLYCEFTYTYAIDLAFDDCPYKAEVERMLRAYPLDRKAKQKELLPDYKAFYQTLLQHSDAAHLHSL